MIAAASFPRHPELTESRPSLADLLYHFQQKSGKFAVPGFPHKLGLLLFGPPGTGKT